MDKTLHEQCFCGVPSYDQKLSESPKLFKLQIPNMWTPVPIPNFLRKIMVNLSDILLKFEINFPRLWSLQIARIWNIRLLPNSVLPHFFFLVLVFRFCWNLIYAICSPRKFLNKFLIFPRTTAALISNNFPMVQLNDFTVITLLLKRAQ